MSFNWWGIIAIVPIIIAALVVFLVAFFKGPKKQTLSFSMSKEEDERYLEESIAIQPYNSPIFKDKDVTEVIKKGMDTMQNEDFRIFKGVGFDV